MDKMELVERLNRLLEAERAGVVVMDMLAKEEDEGDVKERLLEIRNDEGKCCKGLFAMIKDRGVAPTGKTGDFVGKVQSLEKKEDRLSLLVRGQEWVVRKVKELPTDDLTEVEKKFVRDMIAGHEVNIGYVQSLLQ